MHIRLSRKERITKAIKNSAVLAHPRTEHVRFSVYLKQILKNQILLLQNARKDN